MCDDSISLSYSSHTVISFDIMTGAIFVVVLLDISMSVPESEISSAYLLGELGGVSMLSIKLILGVLLLILFVIAPSHHWRFFSLPPIIFLC